MVGKIRSTFDVGFVGLVYFVYLVDFVGFVDKRAGKVECEKGKTFYADTFDVLSP